MLTGTQFYDNYKHLPNTQIQQLFYEQFEQSNYPSFLKNFQEIFVTDGTNKLTYLVTPDYISIGDDSDFLRSPLTPILGQKVANLLNCSLPTTLIVDQIHNSSINKLTPIPKGPPYDHSMMSLDTIYWHNQQINQQMVNKDLSKLTSGSKKDVVISNKLLNYANNVAIYGWYKPDGSKIQGLNPVSHDRNYFDYSHSVRLVYNYVTLNNQPTTLQSIFKDPKLCHLISNEGPLKFLSY